MKFKPSYERQWMYHQPKTKIKGKVKKRCLNDKNQLINILKKKDRI